MRSHDSTTENLLIAVESAILDYIHEIDEHGRVARLWSEAAEQRCIRPHAPTTVPYGSTVAELPGTGAPCLDCDSCRLAGIELVESLIGAGKLALNIVEVR